VSTRRREAIVIVPPGAAPQHEVSGTRTVKMGTSSGEMRVRLDALKALLTGLAGLAVAGQSAAQTPPSAAVFATTKVPGTDNVYYFRYAGHQALFVATPDAVLATDPISFRRPEAALAYLAEIRKITSAPIRYLVYSHSHYDHATGGKPFKAAGATVIGHRNLAAAWRTMDSNDDVVMPDRLVDERMTLAVGREKVELIYLGPSHSDNMLVVYLPAHKLIFSADWLDARGRAPILNSGSNLFPIGLETALRRVLALDWTTMVPGHPGTNGRLGTRQDVERALDYVVDLKAATRQLSLDGKCTPAELAKVPVPAVYAGYAAPESYAAALERYCLIWNQGY
jgi:glyoxylase-like metal-dependent hydrolase (beta-lactamase superfamily II)